MRKHAAAVIDDNRTTSSALLDLGLALGHQRFEVVSLARSNAGMVGAQAWAAASRDDSNGGGGGGIETAVNPSRRNRPRAHRRAPEGTAAMTSVDSNRWKAGHEELRREVG